MEAGQVIDKILADAKAQAGEVGQQARQKEAAEQARVDEQLDRYKSQTKVIAEKAGKDKESHLLAAARMEISKEHLAEKRNMLDEVFEQARASVQKLPDEEYRALMKQLMIEAVETGDEEVIVDRNEKRIDLDFIKEVNRQLGPGYQGNLRLSEEGLDIGGGFILRRGKIKTNVSIGVLLEQARKDLEIELARDLFEESAD